MGIDIKKIFNNKENIYIDNKIKWIVTKKMIAAGEMKWIEPEQMIADNINEYIESEQMSVGGRKKRIGDKI